MTTKPEAQSCHSDQLFHATRGLRGMICGTNQASHRGVLVSIPAARTRTVIPRHGHEFHPRDKSCRSSRPNAPFAEARPAAEDLVSLTKWARSTASSSGRRLVERSLDKREVVSSILTGSTRKPDKFRLNSPTPKLPQYPFRTEATLRMDTALRARACTRAREIIEEFRLGSIALAAPPTVSRLVLSGCEE
jgi:hypothetical protein